MISGKTFQRPNAVGHREDAQPNEGIHKGQAQGPPAIVSSTSQPGRGRPFHGQFNNARRGNFNRTWKNPHLEFLQVLQRRIGPGSQFAKKRGAAPTPGPSSAPHGRTRFAPAVQSGQPPLIGASSSPSALNASTPSSTPISCPQPEDLLRLNLKKRHEASNSNSNSNRPSPLSFPRPTTLQPPQPILPPSPSPSTSPPLKRRRVGRPRPQSRSPRVKIEANDAIEVLPPSALASIPHTPPPLAPPIKAEARSPSPEIPARKLVTQACAFYPLPDNCRKMNPDWLTHRNALIAKELVVLKERKLRMKNVLFREDGMVIEWESSVPVWSDTLLPEPPQSADNHRSPLSLPKAEERSLSPVLPTRKLVTSACAFYPLPNNCRKGNPDWLKHRNALIAKELAVLKERKLRMKNVLFREDGMVIEWESYVPVWSDTLLPEPSTPADKYRTPRALPKPISRKRQRDDADSAPTSISPSLSPTRHTPLPLASPSPPRDIAEPEIEEISPLPPAKDKGKGREIVSPTPTPLSSSSPSPQREITELEIEDITPPPPAKDKGKARAIVVSTPLSSPSPPCEFAELEIEDISPPPPAKDKGKGREIIVSTLTPVSTTRPRPRPLPIPRPRAQPPIDDVEMHDDGSLDSFVDDTPLVYPEWTSEEQDHVEPLALDFFHRYIKTFDTSPALLAPFYAPTALFSCRTPSPTLSPSASASHGPSLAHALAYLSRYKFLPPRMERVVQFHYDVAMLAGEAGGGVMLSVHGEIVDVESGPEGEGERAGREVLGLDQVFVLQKEGEGGSGSAQLVAVSHQMVLRRLDRDGRGVASLEEFPWLD